MPGRPSFSMLATQSPAIFLTPGLFFHVSLSEAEKSTILTPLPVRYFWNLTSSSFIAWASHLPTFSPSSRRIFWCSFDRESHFLLLMVKVLTPAMQPISILLMYLATS